MQGLWRQIIATTPGQVLLLAVACLVAGRLGLLLAVPPGYATAVWPPSGIALAAVLHFGNRVWPGVWLGSFCVNMTLSDAAADPAAQWSATVIAGLIGLGAAAQAGAGAWLVRRWVGYPTALAREGEVFRFLLLAGPVSCLINSTWGVGVLALKGVIPWANTPFNWLTWWVGDTIGVLIFTPLAMVFAGAPVALWRSRRTTVLVPLAVTFGLAVVLFQYARRWEVKQRTAAFEQRAAAVSHAFAERLTGYLEVLHAVERFYESSPEISREQFNTFVSGAMQRFPGIRALEWIPRVAAADRAATELNAREAFPQFQFTEQGPNGRLVRAGEREEYFPVLFIEPVAGNENAIGFDIASEAMRRAAIHRARDTGSMTVTVRIGLVLGPARPAGVLVLLPVYERGFTALPAPTVAARREKLRGYVLGVFSFAEIVRSSVRELDRDGLALGLWDIVAGEGAQELFATQPLAAPTNPDEGLNRLNGHSWTSRHAVGDRTWLMEIRSTHAFLAHSHGWQSWLVLAGSLLFTGLLGILLLVVTGRTVSIEETVDERTRALNRSNEQLAQEVAERNRMDHRLRQMNETLEQRVTARTRALKISEQAALNMMADAQSASRAASEAASALKDSEERFRLVVESAPNAMIMVDDLGRMTLVNVQTERLFGYARQELIGQPIEKLVPERYRPHHPGQRATFFHAPQARAMGAGRDLFGRCQDGTEVAIEIGLNPITTSAGTFVLASIINITERKRAEEHMRASLREKEVLLQEIHHRVKNNLQVVSSLLNLQAEHIQHPETLRAFAESRARIQSMALVHEKIYRDTSLAHIDFSDYLRELTAQLFQNYNINPRQIALRLELAPVAFGLDTAIPCALIVNELISNALKYAFPPGHTGELLVRLRSQEGSSVELEVADNGVGLPAGYDWKQSQSLGLRLVRMLTQQLHGQVQLVPGVGVRYCIVFPPPPPTAQPASQ